MRRRNKTAKRVFVDEIWRRDVDDWFDRGGRATVVAANEAFQAVEVDVIDDTALADHIEALAAHFAEQFVAGFATHGGDIVPTGDFLAHCQDWGIICIAEASTLLAGASPLTTETRDLLAPVAAAVEAATARWRRAQHRR